MYNACVLHTQKYEQNRFVLNAQKTKKKLFFIRTKLSCNLLLKLTGEIKKENSGKMLSQSLESILQFFT